MEHVDYSYFWILQSKFMASFKRIQWCKIVCKYFDHVKSRIQHLATFIIKSFKSQTDQIYFFLNFLILVLQINHVLNEKFMKSKIYFLIDY